MAEPVAALAGLVVAVCLDVAARWTRAVVVMNAFVRGLINFSAGVKRSTTRHEFVLHSVLGNKSLGRCYPRHLEYFGLFFKGAEDVCSLMGHGSAYEQSRTIVCMAKRHDRITHGTRPRGPCNRTAGVHNGDGVCALCAWRMQCDSVVSSCAGLSAA